MTPWEKNLCCKLVLTLTLNIGRLHDRNPTVRKFIQPSTLIKVDFLKV